VNIFVLSFSMMLEFSDSFLFCLGEGGGEEHCFSFRSLFQ